MSQKVKFFRYFRPLDPKTGIIDSKRGITFYVRLNYKKRTMRVSCSVCSGDNFSKLSGKFLACVHRDEGDYIDYDLDDAIANGESVLQYLEVEALSWDKGVWAEARKQFYGDDC